MVIDLKLRNSIFSAGKRWPPTAARNARRQCALSIVMPAPPRRLRSLSLFPVSIHCRIRSEIEEGSIGSIMDYFVQ